MSTIEKIERVVLLMCVAALLFVFGYRIMIDGTIEDVLIGYSLWSFLPCVGLVCVWTITEKL
jgi:hypothetical protein